MKFLFTGSFAIILGVTVSSAEIIRCGIALTSVGSFVESLKE